MVEAQAQSLLRVLVQAHTKSPVFLLALQLLAKVLSLARVASSMRWRGMLQLLPLPAAMLDE
jgi:hypothetical protein